MEILGWIATSIFLVAFYMNTRTIIVSNSTLFLGMNFISGLFMANNSGYQQRYPSMTTNCYLAIYSRLKFLKK